MSAAVAALVLLGLLGLAAWEAYGQPGDAARQALRNALERGEIRAEAYAAHLRALEGASETVA